MFSIEMIGLYNTAIVVTLQNAVVAAQDTLTLEPVTKVSAAHFSEYTGPLWWSRSFIIWPVWISHTLQGGRKSDTCSVGVSNSTVAHTAHLKLWEARVCVYKYTNLLHVVM